MHSVYSSSTCIQALRANRETNMKAVTEIFKKMEVLKHLIDQWGLKLFMDAKEFPLGLSVVKEDGIIEQVNPEFCKIVGYKEEELLGKHFTMLVPEKEVEYFEELHEKFMESPFDLSGSYDVINKKGEVIHLLLTTSLIEQDEIKKRVSLSTDMKESGNFQKKIQDKLEKLNEFLHSLKKEFKQVRSKLKAQETAAGIVRHDLKNQLINIQTLGQMLLEEKLTEEQKKMVKMMVKSSEKALQEIEHSTNIDLLERGQYELDLKRFDLLDLIDNIHERMSAQFENKNLKLLVQSDNPKFEKPNRNPYTINGDKVFMDMLLTNLIQNAVEASPENETILININSGMSIEINIHNWGEVPKEIQPHFFDKYVTFGKRNGTGLGTYICKLIVNAHKGMISMKTSKEEGTYVVMSFPFHALMQASA